METLSVIWTFFKIGIIAFGGGWSTVGIIKNAVVPLWIDESEFTSLIAIAQSSPGPIALNAATMIGWNHGGIMTAMAATISVVLFPIILIVITTILAKKITANKQSLTESLRTGSLAMMLMTLWVLRPLSFDPVLLIYALAAFLIGTCPKINTLWAILGAGAVNALFGPQLGALFPF